MASSPPKPTPIELPLPDSPLLLAKNVTTFRDLNTALKDGVLPPTLDVHIRWLVEFGSIVHQGEKIAQLYYSFHGTASPSLFDGAIPNFARKSSGGLQGSNDAPPTPPRRGSNPNSNNCNANNRSKTRKKRDRRNRGGGQKMTREINDAVSVNKNRVLVDNNSFTSKVVRAPSSGFLRVLYMKPHALDAVQITLFGASGLEMSVVKLILAAIEPCEHPAVVGGLCAVCGADPRAQSNSHQDHRHPSKKLFKDVSPQIQLPTSPKGTDKKKRRKLEFQAKVEASIPSHDVVGTSAAAINTKSIDAPPKDPTVSESKPVPAAKPAVVRSLSSLLSGATATQKLQEPQNQKSSQQRPTPNRPRQTVMSSSSAALIANGDSNMSKVTVSGGVTIAISESEAKSISDASSKKLREEKKLCLVLDLDHTLLHATDDYRAGRFVADEVLIDSSNSEKEGSIQQTGKQTTTPNPEKREDVRSILLPVELPAFMQQQYVQQKIEQQRQGGAKFCLAPLPQQRQDANGCIIMRHFVKLRPYLKEFFAQIQSTYQLSIYTAGTRAYAEQVAVMICRYLIGAILDEEGLNELRSKVKQNDDEFRRCMANVARLKQLQLTKASSTDVVTNKASSKNKSVSFGVGSDGGDTDEQGAAEVSYANSMASGKGQANEMNNCQLADREKQLLRLSEERDRLRQELKDSEELELQATELRRKLFGSRIVSRTDVGDLGKDVKSLKRVFPCGGLMAAILDDREDVWANASNNTSGRPGEPPDNLLLVKPYHWQPFNGYADVNNSSGEDFSKSDDTRGNLDEIDNDDDEQLLWTADILRRLHDRYYSRSLSDEESEELSVPTLLQQMRKETFNQSPKVNIVFSGLIPVNMQLKNRPHVVRYAEELGAKVLPRISNDVTHVVAARDRSEKIGQARREVPGCYIVHTSWLMECYWSLYRRDVRPHHMGAVPPQPVKQHPPGNAARQPEPSHQLSDGDESDDDFADDLEKEMMSLGAL